MKVSRFREAWAAFLLLCGFIAASGVNAAEKKPNILFVFADDWGRCAGAYAKVEGPGGFNDVARTPNFDRVAKEGVLFKRAYVSAPSCTPCRSALLSGQHFWKAGRASILQGAVWDGSLPSFPLLLREGGYHIGETYKVWSPGRPVDAPFDAPRHSYEKAGGRFNQFSESVTKMVAAGKPLEAAKQELFGEVDRNFAAFLADRKEGQPFLYWFGPTNVHRKWQKGSGKALWGLEPDSLKGKMPAFLPDVPEVREDFADYLGEVQAFDAALGLLMAKLEAIGELENTLIVVSGDHGPPGFPHGKCNLYDFGTGVSLAIRGPGTKGGRVVDDFTSLTDLAPTFLELAGVSRPESMTGRSLVPILASDRSGQIDPARDAVFTGRERHVESARADYIPYPQRAVRVGDFLYIINFRPDRFPLGDHYGLDFGTPPTAAQITEDTRATIPDEDAGPTKAWLVGARNDPKWRDFFEHVYGRRPREELYDLRKDPFEMSNVATDPAYAATRVELEERLLKELRRTGDPRLQDDGKFFETPPMSGPLETPKRKK